MCSADHLGGARCSGHRRRRGCVPAVALRQLWRPGLPPHGIASAAGWARRRRLHRPCEGMVDAPTVQIQAKWCGAWMTMQDGAQHSLKHIHKHQAQYHRSATACSEAACQLTIHGSVPALLRDSACRCADGRFQPGAGEPAHPAVAAKHAAQLGISGRALCRGPQLAAGAAGTHSIFVHGNVVLEVWHSMLWRRPAAVEGLRSICWCQCQIFTCGPCSRPC